jgi:hypothetical protein
MSCIETFPIVVRAIIDDPDDAIANGFTEIQIHRSTTDEGGPYAEITTESTRLQVESKKFEYIFEDPNGSPNYFYKFALYDPINVILDTFSDPAPGEQDPALDVCSIDELKTFYLFGVDLTNDKGEEMPDSLYAHYIKSAVDSLEQFLDIQIRKLAFPEERHDYYRDDYDKYIWVALNHQPVISIEEVKLVLPGEQVVQVFEKDWIHIQRESGQLQLVPGTGTAGSILLGASGAYIPIIYGGNKFIPDAFRIQYTAGFGKPPPGSISPTPGSNPPSISNSDPKLDQVPQKIKEVVGKIASFGPFNIAGDLLGGAGIASQSLSIDGLAQSFNTTSSATNAGYGARLVQYNRELKQDLPMLRRYWGRTALLAV